MDERRAVTSMRNLAPLPPPRLLPYAPSAYGALRRTLRRASCSVYKRTLLLPTPLRTCCA